MSSPSVNRWPIIVVLVLAAAGIGGFAACRGRSAGGGPGSGAGVSVPATSSFDHKCYETSPRGPNDLQGTRLPGEACAHGRECKRTCCTCPGGARSFNAAVCTGGRCDDAETACKALLKPETSSFKTQCLASRPAPRP
jgi:hypothetical protein